jgi:hypothetical protein
MEDRNARVIIRAIPVLILLVFILLPFSANGWDIWATIVPANPFPGAGTGFLPGTGGGIEVPPQGPMYSIQGSGLSADGSRIFLDVMMRNPMPMQLDVREFSGSIPVGGTAVTLALVQPVSIPSGGSALVRLEGPAPQGLRSRGSSLPSRPTLGDLKMTVSLGGIEMTLDENAIGAMVS